VGRATLHRWLNSDADFVSEYNSTLKELTEARRQRLRLLAIEATDTIRKMLRSKSTPPTVRAKLATDVLAIADGIEDGPVDPADVKIALDERDNRRMRAHCLNRPLDEELRRNMEDRLEESARCRNRRYSGASAASETASRRSPGGRR
jgi:hypothetical protein